MLLGLAFSVLAVEPKPPMNKTGNTVNVIEMTASTPAQKYIRILVPGEPFAARLALLVDYNRATMTFFRKTVCAVYGFFMTYTQLGFAFLGRSSRTKSTSHLVAVNILVYSVGTMAYQVWLFLMRFSIPRKEQTEVCYVP